MRAFALLTLGLLSKTAQAGGGLGLPDLSTQMRNQNAAAVQRFRGAAQSAKTQRQRLRLQRRARENALRETRRKRRKTLEDSGLLVPKH